MFDSLFKAKFNWYLYLFIAIIIRAVFVEISWLSYIAVMISAFQVLLLFNSIAYIIPVRYLLGCFMCLQFFIGPTFAYNGLDDYQYEFYIMRVPETEYFAYAIPAVSLFILGLHIMSNKLQGEKVDEKAIQLFVIKVPRLPYFLIILGFLSSIISGFFGSELAFVFYLLGSFKFIGLFLLILGSKQLKPLPMILVIGSIISSSLGSGMFHDLLTWVIFTAAVYGIKYKFDNKIKLIGAGIFLVLVSIIQVMKGTYREMLSGDASISSAETFVRLAEEKNESGSLLNFKTLAGHNVRINQGFIITNIMRTVPERVPFENGTEMMQILEAAILPRVLSPDKLRAGDRKIFMKYTGMMLGEGTSMGLSSLGDAYINFGAIGGCIFMFCLGLLYNYILKQFGKYAKYYPILILFTALVFYYPIRPDCELQTILGHLFKSVFLIIFIINVWKHQFYVRIVQKIIPPKPALT